jgi:hypothetical protein
MDLSQLSQRSRPGRRRCRQGAEPDLRRGRAHLRDSGTELSGTIRWGHDGLDLKGTIQPATATTPLSVQIVGTGRKEIGTEGWEYDYNASLAHQWPAGINQVQALVGSVIRAKPHGTSPAGYVASFVAVKQR